MALNHFRADHFNADHFHVLQHVVAAVIVPADLTITDTDILHKPVDCALAGEQLIKDRYREWHVPQAKTSERTTVRATGARRLGGKKPTFATRTDKRGYD